MSTDKPDPWTKPKADKAAPPRCTCPYVDYAACTYCHVEPGPCGECQGGRIEIHKDGCAGS